MRANRFKSKTDALRRAQPVWVCLKCSHETTEKPGVTDGRVTILDPCQLCGGDFHRFPSGTEGRRYKALLLERGCGMISELELQPVFPVVINGKKVFKYYADFRYLRGGVRIVEDVKGSEKAVTDVFKLKKKIVEAVYGISITVVIWK